MLLNRPEDYEAYYRACFESFPSAPEAGYCHWKVAWNRYVRRKPDADAMLREHIGKFPASEKVGAAMYYLARSAERNGDEASAKALLLELNANYPNYYYAVLARERLAEPRFTRVAANDEATAFLTNVAFPQRRRTLRFEPDAATKERLERARLLHSLDASDLAEEELRFSAANEGQAHVLALELAKLATRRGSPDEGIRYIKRFVPGYLFMPVESAPASFWRHAFPLPYRTDLERNARERNLDPFLVAALVRQESEFNPNARSPVNAHGLTQVMPATGRQLSRTLGIKGFRTSMLLRPDINLKFGTYYLRRMYDELSGRLEPTLASYNAGKSRAVDWLGWADYREPAEFVENIPFTETRNYVQYVTRNADIYKRLYTGKAIPEEEIAAARPVTSKKTAKTTKVKRAPVAKGKPKKKR
jgi:soluble lytic murein transglycosylase